MSNLRVVVSGAVGRMGQETVRAVWGEQDMEIVGAAEVLATADSLPLPDGGSVPLSKDLAGLLDSTKADVVVDFTVAGAVMGAVKASLARGVNMVIGTTGITSADIDQIGRLADEAGTGIVIAPNFALGAVLMMHLAALCGRYFDNAEIIELHHDKKLDAPSGTALTTARHMIAARGKPFHEPATSAEGAVARGQLTGGIALHSVRLPGLMAHQEVIFGGSGQTLTIRHDTISRECFMPGVILAVREVMKRKGLTLGLDKLLGL